MEFKGKSLRTRMRILDAAEPLLKRLGLAGLRMETLASHLGVSKKTLYNHFPGGKREIWRLCVERRMEESSQHLFTAMRDASRGFVERGIDLIRIGQEATEELYGPNGLVAPGADADYYLPEHKQQLVEGLEGFFAEGVSLGVLRSNIPLHALSTAVVTLILEWGREGGPSLDNGGASLPVFVETVLLCGILSEDSRHRYVQRFKEGSQ
ncbi:MAG: TetR/AcrR family transcriptional regulator [Spirochaetales bacterium]|nr:TetR/AcrR family transcriptional regulator [Spirochaetales bacterium]